MRKLQLAGALLATSLLLAAGPNLARNSSFEDSIGPGTMAEGWVAGNMPAGGFNAVTDTKARTGHFSHKLTVPDGAEITWYQCSQDVKGTGPGKTYTFSVYVQTDGVHDGYGAYCSLGCFDVNGLRVGYSDSPDHLTGTVAEWRRVVATMKIPAGTSVIKAILVFHGHGTAWFDDVQFEEGAAATAYGPSVADDDAVKADEREQAEAAGIFRTTPLVAGRKGVAAILRDTLPADGFASSPDRLGKWLGDAGYGVTYLTGAQLANRFVLRGPRGAGADGTPPINLLVLPYGGTFPAAANRSMQSFLRHGGTFLSTGGYAFDTLLVQYEGKWFKPQDLPPPTTPILPLMDFNTGEATPAGWSEGSDPDGTPPKLTLVPGRPGAGRALEFSVNPLHQWATASIPMSDRLPSAEATGGKSWAVTRFWAKGDAGTPKMEIEWDETDGSRWHCAVPLTTEWKEYSLNVADFTYWQDNPSVGRGGYGDHLHPENASRLLIGVALDIVARDKPHTFWVDDLAVQTDPQSDLRLLPPCMNTRAARINDAMWPTPEQISVFDPSHPLEFVRAAKASGGQFIVPEGLSLDGPVEGYAAVGMLGNQGHGFGPNLLRLVPILDGVDRFGRFQGPVGSIMHAFAGYYLGASWAFFGATNRDLFADTSAAREVFVNTADALVRGLYVRETGAEMSSYRPGDTARFLTTVNNSNWRRGAKDATVTVRMEALAQGASKPAFSQEKTLTLKPGASQQVSFGWKVPADAADLYILHATVLEAGKPVDQEAGGLVVWSDRADRPTTTVGKKGPYFSFGDTPKFVVGCQTYWGQNGSYTARSPLAFERDYAMMQDYGLHFSRLFVPWGDATQGALQAAQSDAMMQLAQKHRILFYNAPNLPPTPVASELADEEVKAKALGERYKGIPWMTVDVCNEPSFRITDERMAGPLNDWLKAKYGTTEALRQAWGADAPELGKVKPVAPTTRSDDLRTLDEYLFVADIEQRWADGNRAAIQAADPSRLVSVGNLQGYGWGEVSYDPPTCAEGLDFSDRHFYGPPQEQSRELKDIDLRILGHPLIQGECGAKDHPTYATSDPWGMGDTPEKFTARFTSLVHHAFGVGATALSSWHWRDPMEGIFPCGITHADNVPRPAASVMRAMAFTFSRLRPTYRTPEVLLLLPDSHRFGGDRFAVLDAIHRCEDMLMGCQVDFGTITEGQLSKLPNGVRAIVYPIPYCPSDETVAALKAFVQKGGALYFSGDISFDPMRKRTRAQRLIDLAGVERVGERSVPGSMLAPIIRLVGAQALRSDNEGRPVVTLNKLGAGIVYFCAEPIEASPLMPGWSRATYLEFLSHAGADRNPVTPDVATLQCFQVPLEDGGRAFVLYNNSDKATTATVTLAQDEITLEIAPNCPGLIVVGPGRTLQAVEAQGAVTRNGKPIATIRGHAIIQSLDGKDLGSARQLLILPWPGIYGRAPQPGTPGQVSLASLAGMRVELGELRATKWTRLEALKADGGRVTFDEEQSRNVIIAAAPDQFVKAAGEVEALTLAK